MKDNEAISKVLLTIKAYKGNVDVFRKASRTGEYSPSVHYFSRLLLWKVSLITDTLRIQDWDVQLRSSRVVYHKLSASADLRVPWFELSADSEFAPSDPRSGVKPHKLTRINNVSDPLAQKEAAGLSNHDVELLELIVLDVQRLFPGEPMFHDGSNRAYEVKKELITILYVWAKCNPQVGYKQGIHEILGLIYMHMAKESVDIGNTDDFSGDDLQILAIYDKRYLSHDLFTLLNKFLISSGVVEKFYQSEQVLMQSISDFNGLLMKVDQIVHYNLETKLRLELQLWIIRYFRLLLLRELVVGDLASLLWDRLAAAQGGNMALHSVPEITMLFIVIMLLMIKSELMLCDFSEALSLLLHYPISSKLTLYPDLINRAFKDAYLLYENRNNDLKLFEIGQRLSSKYSGKIRVSIDSDSRLQTPSATSSPKTSVDLPTLQSSRAAKMAFEKQRLEARLKKKARLMVTG